MMTPSHGAFVISWSQTRADGLSGPPPSAISVGARWAWSGAAVEIEGASAPASTAPVSDGRLRREAASAVRKLVGASLRPVRPLRGNEFGTPDLERSFVVTDERRTYRITLVDVPEVARPLLLFVGRCPPPDTELRIIRDFDLAPSVNRVMDVPTGVICFTTGTALRTPDGPRRVEDLREGDLVDTVDAGPQEILWIGARRMSGARLHAMPELRPVRIRAGALGDREPDGDLIVSPRHKVLVRGAVAREAFGTPEVLVAADDLLNDFSVMRDHALPEVTYVHLLLPRHHVVWANGVQTESFHPASTDLETIDTRDLGRLMRIVPGLDVDPHGYGESVRRELTRDEAAIFRDEGLFRR